ncbi:MAG: DUF748 domain-containing protein [Thermodesulfobacteriota bacterium]
MKKWFVITGVVAVLLVAGYLLASFYAVKFIQARLQQVIGPGLTVGKIKIKPTHLSANGVQYEAPLLKRRIFLIEEVKVYPALSSFFKGTLSIRKWEMIRPSFYYYRSREGNWIGLWGITEKTEKVKEVTDGRKEKEKEKEEESVPIQIDRFRITGGSIDFEDGKEGEPPAKIKLRDIDLEIKGIQYPLVSTRSRIELSGRMKGETKDGRFSVKGWIDLKTIDMETSLAVEGIEIRTLEPYYRKNVSSEIETGYVDMQAEIAVKKRVIDAPGRLVLRNLRFKEKGTVFWIPAKTLVSLLKDRGDRIPVRFHVKGNVDDPEFNLREAFLTRVALSFAEVLGIPIKVVGKTILEGTGKGVEGLVEGFKSLENLFRKKKEKER